MKRLWLGAAAVFAVFCVGLVVTGPRARMGELHAIPSVGEDVESYLAVVEGEVPGIRPGAAKRLVWADSTRRVATPIALVYVHGFTADSHEVEPLVTDLGRELGANVFFTRLAGHGRDAAAMGEATVDAWLGDMAEALMVGRRIGERVVVVGTSTGGTLAVWAALEPTLADEFSALVLLSPNFHPRNRLSRLLLWPWGGVLARWIEGRERCFPTHSEAHARHWTECHATEALLPMMALVEHVRTAALEAVRVPLLVAYVPDDEVVDASETEQAFARFGSEVKFLWPVNDVGDPDRHVPAGDILSPGTTESVRDALRAFVVDVLEIEIAGR